MGFARETDHEFGLNELEGHIRAATARAEAELRRRSDDVQFTARPSNMNECSNNNHGNSNQNNPSRQNNQTGQSQASNTNGSTPTNQNSRANPIAFGGGDDPDRPFLNQGLTETSEESCEFNLLEFCKSLIGAFESLVVDSFASKHAIPTQNNLVRHEIVKKIRTMMRDNYIRPGVTYQDEFDRTGVVHLDPIADGNEIRFGQDADIINLNELIDILGSMGQSRVTMINERGEWEESFPYKSPQVGRVNTIILSGVHNIVIQWRGRPRGRPEITLQKLDNYEILRDKWSTKKYHLGKKK